MIFYFYFHNFCFLPKYSPLLYKLGDTFWFNFYFSACQALPAKRAGVFRPRSDLHLGWNFLFLFSTFVPANTPIDIRVEANEYIKQKKAMI